MLSKILTGRWLAVGSVVVMFAVGGARAIGWIDSDTASVIIALLVGTAAAGGSAVAPTTGGGK